MIYIPIIAIATSMLAGLLIGSAIVLYRTRKEIEILEKELNYFRTEYFNFLKQFQDKYPDR
jgi:cell division protein FtsL